MKKYILRSLTIAENKNHFMFVSCLGNELYYLTWNSEDATRFKTIGDAMRKSMEIYKKNSQRFKAVPVDE